MKFYLSSYKIGGLSDKLKSLLTGEENVAVYISNAFDGIKNEKLRKVKEEEDKSQLKELGFRVLHVNLQDYFGKTDKLKEVLSASKLLWISGGNVFVLRRAMKLSGFDSILRELIESGIVYGGYSAAGCVLSPSLKGYHIVDDPSCNPYNDEDTMWDGLNLIQYNIAPHFDSNHPESEAINKEINYCIENNIPYKALRDGEVIII